MSATGWGGTLSAVFGVGGNARGGASGEREEGRVAATVAGPGGLQQKQKGEVRRRLPDWTAGEAGEEVGQPNEEDGLEDGVGNQDSGNSQLDGDELDRLAATILWQVRDILRRGDGFSFLSREAEGRNRLSRCIAGRQYDRGFSSPTSRCRRISHPSFKRNLTSRLAHPNTATNRTVCRAGALLGRAYCSILASCAKLILAMYRSSSLTPPRTTRRPHISS